MRSLQAAAGRLAELDATIFGISADAVETQRAFHEAEQLSFGLLSDPRWEAIGAFGAMHWLLPAPGRRTVLIDRDGRVAHVWPNVRSLDGHGDAVADQLAALKSSPDGAA